MSSPLILPTEDNHFKAYYQIWIGIVPFVIGLAVCAFALWSILQSNSFNSAVILGSLLAIAGCLYLTRPYFVLAPNRLTIYNLIGRVVKRYPFETFSNLKIEDSKLYIDGGFLGRDHLEPTELKKWLVKSQDWKKLQEIITA